jgi:endonuclease III
MDRTSEAIAERVLERHGRTFADEAGIRLADQPAALFQLLVLALLLSTRIGAGIAVAAASALQSAGWTTPQRMREAPRSAVIAALGRSGYRRYDERTATRLREMAGVVLEKYGGDLRRLAARADQDADRARALVQEFNGIGPTGAAVFLREVQAVWAWVRPYLDTRAIHGAERVGLPTDASALAELVPPDELARFAAALVRVSLWRSQQDPLGDADRDASSASA